jgi:hypothetical protein
MECGINHTSTYSGVMKKTRGNVTLDDAVRYQKGGL